jgi:hypothetical protein
MAGPVEGISKVASGAIEALHASPVLLALMMMNLLMIGGLLYVAKVQVDERHYIANQRDEMIKVILDRCQALK